MSIENLFNTANKLKNYSVLIGSTDLVKESIQTIEISYKNNTPVILAKIIINDIYELNQLHLWRNETIVVQYMDMFDKQVKHEFVILNVDEKHTDTGDKVIIIELQDKFSYVLEHSFLSKSFKSDPVSVIKKYITELKLTSYEQDFSNLSKTYEFVVPKNVSNLDFFLFELYKHGYTFYQTKTNVKIKGLSDLVPSSLNVNGLFTNSTDNQLYENMIFEFRPSLNKRRNIIPKTRSLAYDFNIKKVVYNSDNDNSPYYLNDDKFNLQDTSGLMDLYSQHLNFDMHKLYLKNSFLDQSELQIITNGYGKNDVNQIYEIKLKGNKSTSELQQSGNIVVNGKYISTSVTDKIVGDSMIQRIFLNRADLQKKIK